MELPVIPEFITVHLGDPDDASAPNVQVPFIDYIKNVASSEIYPTWPENSLRANIYAQISFALNRIYTEWYRSQGYPFDITSSTQYDQKFIDGRDVFQNVSEIVDEIFNNYVVRNGYVQPLFTEYCNGTTVLCEGLSQWGTVDLAREGLTPYEILQHYYGDDISIVYNAPVSQDITSYPGVPLKLGTISEEVRTIQRQLNRIAQNYPAIPVIENTNGNFDVNTENAVKKFQEIFNLEPDGVVGKSTWYQIKYIYNSVKKLSELDSEGLRINEVDRIFSRVLREGDSGEQVANMQYALAVIGFFDPNIPPITVDGYFGEETRNAVYAFQKQNGLPVDGIVGRNTWNAILRAYEETLASIPPQYAGASEVIYPGYSLAEGQSGAEVRRLQNYINQAARTHPYIPTVAADGQFGPQTAAAVRAIQQNNGISVTGLVGPVTWDTIVRLAGAI